MLTLSDEFKKHMKPMVDLTNKKFGYLTALKCVGKNKFGQCVWRCVCECGNILETTSSSLNSGNKTSCGAKQHKRIRNHVEFDSKYAYIYVSGRKEPAIIDKEDYDNVKIYHWNNEKPYKYTTTTVQCNNYKQTIRLHRLVMGVTDKNVVVDHINGNTLDNRKCNLRIATFTQNIYNHKKRKSKTNVTGVSKRHNKYCARIGCNNKEIYLGLFNTLEDATNARIEAEKIYFGEFRRVE